VRVHPYLNFDGCCDEAFRFYADVLGGKITFVSTWGESPMREHLPATMHGRIMHATMAIGDEVLMGADSPPDRFAAPRGFQVSLHFGDPSDGERVFRRLAEGGNVQMPFAPTFWSPGFGVCVDKFGTPWMVNCDGEPTT
jgi:PhnB protein